jgi:hypothetical protein
VLHKQSVSPPRSSNRTCGFPASGSPTGFTAGMRRAFDTSVLSVSVPPWLHDTACSESFRNYAVLYRLAPSHPPSPSSTSTPEVRVLSSTGVTQLHRYYDPVRLPLEPMPYGTVEAATLAQHGPPPLARSPVSTCRAHYPGGPVQVRLSAASPDRAAFPELRAGRRPQLPFRGLLRLHSHYGPSSRSPARGGLCRRASIQPIAQLSRLPATGPTDHCPGGTCTHKVIAPFGAHRSFTEKKIMRFARCSIAVGAKRHKILLRETCISILCQEGGGPAWLAPRRPWRGGSRVKHGLASPSRSEGPLSNLYNPNSCKVTQTVLQVWE